MNDAHLHLIVNHFPIVGINIGLLVLIVGFLLKNPQVKATSLGIFIFSALAAIAANYTGEGAEEIVEKIPGISESFIHDHEEYAEQFFTLSLILGGAALITLFLQIKKWGLAAYGYILVIILTISSLVSAYYVGVSGGEIRHTEIRETSNLENQPDFIKSEENDD
ncbi:hypothetical protein ACKGJN_13655 [Gillisia sp. Q332]|uniref:hypothetical protein n=1 Tax=Gillisia xinjiangensis TaxID=3384765 RepID=UPI00391D5478